MEINQDQLYRVIGDRLKQQRIALGLSQDALAKRIELRRTSVTNIEGGQQKAPLHVLYRFCAALGIPIAEVLPQLSEVRVPTREEIVVDDRVRVVTPRTARFLRSLEEESNRRSS